jgi:hypothetical protein
MDLAIGVDMTIRHVDVTLTHDEASYLCGVLSDFARERWNCARRTKSASVREYAKTTAGKARDFEALLVRRMYVGESVDVDATAGKGSEKATEAV